MTLQLKFYSCRVLILEKRVKYVKKVGKTCYITLEKVGKKCYIKLEKVGKTCYNICEYYKRGDCYE